MSGKTGAKIVPRQFLPRGNQMSHWALWVGKLKVMLLSGRCCTQFFSRRYSNLSIVLRDCAESLGLDPLDVAATGTLVQETRVIHDLQTLEPGKRHELTLVLS